MVPNMHEPIETEDDEDLPLEERCLVELERSDYRAALKTAEQLVDTAEDAEEVAEYMGLKHALRAAASAQLEVAACMLQVESNPSMVELDFRPTLTRRLSAMGEYVLAAAITSSVNREDSEGTEQDDLLRQAGLTREQLSTAFSERMCNLLRAHAAAHPSDYVATSYLIKALLREVETQAEALPLARSAAERFPGLESSMLLAHALDEVGEVSEARRLLTTLCERFPGSHRPLVALSESYADDDLVKAANFLELAYEREPDPDLFDHMCELLDESEQYDKLAARLEAAYARSSSFQQHYYALTLVRAYRAMQQPRPMKRWFWVAARQRGFRIVQLTCLMMLVTFTLAVISVPPMAAVWAAVSGSSALVLVAVLLGNKDALTHLFIARFR